MRGRKRWIMRTGPMKLTLASSSHTSGVFSRNGITRSSPATLAMMSGAPPMAFITWSTKASMLWPSVRSSATNSPSPPAPRICASVARPCASLRSPPYTTAPALANCSAVARPMPDAQPVTTTVLPVRSVTRRQAVSRTSFMSGGAPKALREWFISRSPGVQKSRDARAGLGGVQQLAAQLALQREAVAVAWARGGDELLGRGQCGRRQGGDARGQCRGLVDETGARHGPLHEAQRVRRGTVDHLGAQDQPAREPRAAQAREPLRSAEPGDEPEPHLGQAQLRFPRGDAQIAAQRQFEAAAE